MRLLLWLILFTMLPGYMIAQTDSLKTGVRFITVSSKDSLQPLNESIKKQLTGLQKQATLQDGNLRLTLQLKNQTEGLITARWLAVRQKKNILHIDLSVYISKYIGETEKNLEKLFSKAADGNILLFFDEADALFGKRTGGNESDNQNREKTITLLIKKMEGYKGPVLLNCKAAGCPYLPARLHFIRISG
jgi:ATPase family associated with various cellular activities (AAA)